jgi:hypothetical protein
MSLREPRSCNTGQRMKLHSSEWSASGCGIRFHAALTRPRDARLTARSRLALHAQHATDVQTSNEAAVRQLPWPILPSPSPTAKNRLLNVREEP